MKSIWYFIFRFVIPVYIGSGICGLLFGYAGYLSHFYISAFFSNEVRREEIIYFFVGFGLIAATYMTVTQFIIFRQVQRAQAEEIAKQSMGKEN